MSDISKLSEDDKKKLIAAGSHMGLKNVHQGMTEYILYQRSNGNFVINLNKTWEKILLAAYKIVETQKHDVKNNDLFISYDPSGQKSIVKFDYPTGGLTYENCSIEDFLSNPDHGNQRHILVETYHKYDSSYIIAFCNTDNPLENVDLVIPCNNKSIASIGLIWWLLTREILRLQGKGTENAEWNICKFSEKPQAECGEYSNTIECDYDETAPRYCSNNQLDKAETFRNNSSSNDLSEFYHNFSSALELNDNKNLDRSSTTSSLDSDENLDKASDTNQLSSSVTSRIRINPDYIRGLNLNNQTILDYSNYDAIKSIEPPHFDYVDVYSQKCNLFEFLRFSHPVNFPGPTQFLGATQRYDFMQFPGLPQFSNVVQRFNPVQFAGRVQFSLPQVFGCSQFLHDAPISSLAPSSGIVSIYRFANYPIQFSNVAQFPSSTRVFLPVISNAEYPSPKIFHIPHSRND